jgi:glycosyltransferase involved in cell wall biosynthesis
MDRGGAELRTIDVMRQSALSGFEFHFATLASGQGALDGTIRRLNGHVHRCALGFTFPQRFRRLLRDHDIQVVHSHVHYFSGYILRLATEEHVPKRIAHLWSTGDGQPATLRRRIQRALTRRWLDRAATDIIAVSEGAMRQAWREDWGQDDRCLVIYQGLDLRNISRGNRHQIRSELGLRDGEPLIVHVGTMSSDKNQERVVRIFSSLQKQRPDCRLLLVGRDGDGTRSRVEQLIRDLHLSERVLILGEREDVPALLNAADLMIFPSLREGLPGAVLEACASGTAVVASDLPGICEIRRICPTVVCVPLAAADEAWADTTERLLNAPPKPVDLVGGAFDAATAAARLRAVYEAPAN